MNILKIAARNLLRYRRRTLLTALLITVGIVAVLMFIAIAGSFKTLMVGQITDSMLGHIQIHQKGYVASIDNLPLNLNLNAKQVEKLTEVLKRTPGVEAYSYRIKFGAMFSNFNETSNIRLNAVDPEAELNTVPLLRDRVLEGPSKGDLLKLGQILLPELLARGMKVKVGDTVVIVANNKDGSVNGQSFVVGGILRSVTGPGGRDGYLRLDDARQLLRLSEPDVSEVAIRLTSLDHIPAVYQSLQQALGQVVNPAGKPVFEVHTWKKLSPFVNIANMIDLMNLFIQIMLIAIVLISIMNVMVMAVYERIREIGTISAIGTVPSRILSLFLAEGFLLGLVGAVIGTTLSLGAIMALNALKLTISFGRQDNMVLEPTIDMGSVLTISLVVIAVAVLASLQPAFKASRMDPIEALRHV